LKFVKRTLPKEKGTLNCIYDVWNGYGVEDIWIEDLWPIFPAEELDEGKPFFGPLKEDIEKNGMNNPIVIVPITKDLTDRWEGRMGMWLYRNPIDWEGKDTQLAVFTGNNRYQVAIDLGYERIDSIILKVDDLVAASRLQYPITTIQDKEKKIAERMAGE
jgi:hypothetical protein